MIRLAIATPMLIASEVLYQGADWLFNTGARIAASSVRRGGL